MRVLVLGIAAGGGVPQWNCACAGCQLARADPERAWPRLHCALALSGAGEAWYLIGAGPDIGLQIGSLPALRPGPEPRSTPLRGVLLTAAELDHTIGLLVLREGGRLDIHGTGPVLGALGGPLPIRPVLQAYSSPRWIEVVAGRPKPLEDGRLTVTAFPLGDKRPRYADACEAAEDWVVGYTVKDLESGGTAVFAPCVARWTADLETAVAGADCTFFDGTFWSDDELALAGVGTRTAAAMGHLPIGGAGGSARRLTALGGGRKVYVHLNNTNPVLGSGSPERQELDRLGLEVGFDGLEACV